MTPGVAVLAIDAGDVELRDLAVTGPTLGLRVQGTGHASLSGVIIEGTGGTAISVDAASLALSDVAITHAQRGAIVATAGASVQGAGIVLADNRGLGLSLGSGASAVLEELVVRGTLVGDAGAAQLSVQSARAALRTVVLEDSEAADLRAAGTASVSVDGAVVRTTRALAGPKAVSVDVASGAELTLRSTSFDGLPSSALRVTEATATLEDVVIRGPATPSLASGACVLVSGGSRIVARRIALSSCVRRGLSILGPATSAALEDVAVRGSVGRDDPGDRLPVGIEVVTASVSLVRARLDAIAGTSLFMSGVRRQGDALGAWHVTVSDLEVTSPGWPREDGVDHAIALFNTAVTLARVRVTGVRFGLQALESQVRLDDAELVDVTGSPGAMYPPPVVMMYLGTVAFGSRLRVAGGATGGVNAAGGSQLDLTDLDVSGTGMWAARSDDASWLTVDRARIRDVREAGVSVNDASFVASNLEVDGVRDSTELERGGVATKGFARLVVDRFAIRRCDVAGLRMVGEFGDELVVHLGPGLFSGNALGAEVFYPEFDPADVTRGVRFEDNDRDLRITSD
jgi:hypothetical protein